MLSFGFSSICLSTWSSTPGVRTCLFCPRLTVVGVKVSAERSADRDAVLVSSFIREANICPLNIKISRSDNTILIMKHLDTNGFTTLSLMSRWLALYSTLLQKIFISRKRKVSGPMFIWSFFILWKRRIRHQSSTAYFGVTLYITIRLSFCS